MAAVRRQSTALTRREALQLSTIGGIINGRGVQKNIVLTLRLKTGLIEAIKSRGDSYFGLTEAKKRELKPELVAYVKFASGCRVGNDQLVGVVNRLIEEEEDKASFLKLIVYKKRYETPEIVPQQFAHQFQELLPTKFNQGVDVYFLLDQMVGYIFQDGTKWTQGELLKEVVV